MASAWSSVKAELSGAIDAGLNVVEMGRKFIQNYFADYKA